VFAEWEGERVVFGQELSEAAVVRDERGHDAESTTCLADGRGAREIGCFTRKGEVVSVVCVANPTEARAYQLLGA
jgi:hypothetical protein